MVFVLSAKKVVTLDFATRMVGLQLSQATAAKI